MNIVHIIKDTQIRVAANTELDVLASVVESVKLLVVYTNCKKLASKATRVTSNREYTTISAIL